jgi:hypothetical protein
MLRRCFNWDYCAPAIYMITLTLADRSKPLLGRVVPIFPQGTFSAYQIGAKFLPSSLGEAIVDDWKNFQKYRPEIRPLYLQLMEEHLHGIIQVTKQMPKPLGNAIAGFKGWCNKYYRQINGAQTPLFSPGFQDSILLHAGQLSRMFNYLRDNPRRLAIRRQFPNLFTSVQHLQYADGAFDAFGNIFLLDKTHFHLLQVSRTANAEDMRRARNAIHRAISSNAVIVSPYISPGERILMDEALDLGASFIALQSKGFPPLYKPSGKLFDACATGHLLLLTPSEWTTIEHYTKHITREKCYVLNALAAKIAGGLPQSIRYHGQSPENLELLLQQAGFPPR